LLITGLTGHWWPGRIVWPGVELAFAVVVVIALSLLGSVVLSSTANGIGVFMLFGAGLVAGLLATIGHALNSHVVKQAATVTAWALPFEALYQDALRMITERTSGLTGFLLQLGPFGGAYVHGWPIRLWSVSGRSPGATSRPVSAGSGDRDLAREPRVLRDEGLVRALRAAAALAMQVREDVRRHRLARHALLARCAERPLDQRLDVLQRLVRRAPDEKAAAAEVPVRERDPRSLVRRLDPRRDGRPARGRVEERQRVDAEAEHGNP